MLHTYMNWCLSAHLLLVLISTLIIGAYQHTYYWCLSAHLYIMPKKQYKEIAVVYNIV
jgi:hypothetical protein